MNAYVYPIRVGGREILIVFDDQYITWLDSTDPVVRVDLLWYIEEHPEAGVMDLLHFCISQDLACGLVFGEGDETLLAGPLS